MEDPQPDTIHKPSFVAIRMIDVVKIPKKNGSNNWDIVTVNGKPDYWPDLFMTIKDFRDEISSVTDTLIHSTTYNAYKVKTPLGSCNADLENALFEKGDLPLGLPLNRTYEFTLIDLDDFFFLWPILPTTMSTFIFNPSDYTDRPREIILYSSGDCKFVVKLFVDWF